MTTRILVAVTLAACGQGAAGTNDDASDAGPDAVSDAGGSAAAIEFSRAAGLFSSPFELSVTTASPGTLHYTLDGAPPTAASARVSGALDIDATTEVRVALFDADADAVRASRTYILAGPEIAELDTNLPIVIVETFGEPRIDDEERPRSYYPVYTLFVDTGEDGRARPFDTPAFAGRAGMHIRGNSTTGYEKKQYRLELWDELDEDTSAPLLGLAKESDWILHAPFSDKTLMRNHLMYTWSNRIGRYAARTVFVEAFIDREGDGVDFEDYAGVYVFMETIKRDESRVNVAKDGGYLLQRDWDWTPETGIMTELFGDMLHLKWPKPERVTGEERDEIQSYLDEFEAVLDGEDFADPITGYAAYIDVDSFIDHHLLVEIARNVDGFVLSTYAHKDAGGPLVMGPIWDYNGSLGNADYYGAWDPIGWHSRGPTFPEDNPSGYAWYARLFDDPAFRARYAERWRELRQDLLAADRLSQDIDATAALLTEAAPRNFERWPVLGEYVWPNAEGFEDRLTYQSEVSYLKNWLSTRAQWMDSELAP